MMLVFATNLPPAVRGRLKLWFIEPRANVFVSGVKDALAKRVLKFLLDHCPPSSGLMVFTQTSGVPGYIISSLGKSSHYEMVTIDGLQLIKEPPSQGKNTSDRTTQS